MKKRHVYLLFLINLAIVILLGVLLTKRIDRQVKEPVTVSRAALDTVNTGTGANTGTGDPIRTAFEKINDAVNLLNSLGLYNYTDSLATRNNINDSIQYLLTNAVVGLALTDSSNNTAGRPEYYATPKYVEGYIGSGGGGSFTGDILKYIIGTTTGAPSAGDSLIIHSAFTGNQIDLYRNGALQYFHTEAVNTIDSVYRISTDTITVRPDWANNERIEIRVRNPISWSYLSLEGQESSLLDTLIVYYKLDDSGTSFDDAMDVQDASNSAANTSRTSTGAKFNYARQIDYHGYIYMPYNATVNPDTIFSVSMWIYADSIGATDYLFSALATGGAVSNPIRAYINSSGYLVFRTYNSAASQYGSISNTTLSDSTLYHVCFVHRGNGKTNLIYLNGTDVTAAEGGITQTFSGDLYQSNAAMYFGNYTSNHAYNFRGKIDEAMIYHKILTQANVTALYGLTAPLK